MAKGRGLLQGAVKAVKQQQKKPAKTPPGPKSASGSRPGANPGAGPPAAKKQKTGGKPKNKNAPLQQNQKPTIPFSPSDPILLIGEGDLSFAASLITHHHCTNLTATVLEKDHAELSAKYPHVDANIAVITSQPGCRLLYATDATKLPAFTTTPLTNNKNNLHTQQTAPAGAMKRIIFNFPHTGGKSTDVNRQVRHNQELLVAFFRRAQLSLAPRGATIVVTLFEGEPYTLWNIRDLARHAGLQVERSFKFVAGVYPGYEHARTLGVVRNRKGEVAKGAWRGAERGARSFVFVRKGEGEDVGGRKRKRGGGEGDGDDESSESEESGAEGGWGEEGEDEDELEEEEEEEVDELQEEEGDGEDQHDEDNSRDGPGGSDGSSDGD